MKRVVLGIAMLCGISGCSSMLYYPEKEMPVDPAKWGFPAEDVFLKTEDGLTLHAWRFVPKEKPVKGRVLVFHGNAENISTHFAGTVWLTQVGYEMLIFDYRGYGTSEGKPSPQGTVMDGKAAVKWASQLKPSRPLIVYGQSLGGAVALRTLIEMKEANPGALDNIKGIVIESSFKSYRSVGRRVLSHHALTWLFQPLAYVVLSDRYAPGNRIAELAPTPLLVVHSKNDPVVDFGLGEGIYKAAQDPKEFWSVDEPGHIDSFWVAKTRERPRLIKWINERSLAPLKASREVTQDLRLVSKPHATKL